MLWWPASFLIGLFTRLHLKWVMHEFNLDLQISAYGLLIQALTMCLPVYYFKVSYLQLYNAREICVL